MKLLKLFVLGIIIWGMSLLWLEINLLLTPAAMTGLVFGLAVFLGAYFLGQIVGPVDDHDQGLAASSADPTRPIRLSQARNHHSRPTLPLRTGQTQKLHSHPTRPMSIS